MRKLLFSFCLFFAVVAKGQYLDWAQKIGSPGSHTEGKGLVLDHAGNVYMGGTFYATVDFDPGPAVFNMTSFAPLELDVYITKRDSSGSFIWAVKVEGGTNKDFFDIKADGDGNIYVTGVFEGTVDLDPGAGVLNTPTVGTYDIFLIKLDPSGSLIWAKTFGSTYGDGTPILKIDAADNVYLTGIFNGTLDADPGPGVFNLYLPVGGDQNQFIVKLDAGGNFVYAKQLSSTTGVSIGDFGIDASGSLVIAGMCGHDSDLDPGPGVYMDTIWPSSFLLKLDPAGNLDWAHMFSTDVVFRALVIDATGNITITGQSSGICDIDPATGAADTAFLVSPALYANAFVVKYDGASNYLWSRSFDGYSSTLSEIDIDSSGILYMAGTFNTPTDFDAGPGAYILTPLSMGDDDICVVKMDNHGGLMWAKSIGSIAGDGILGMVIGQDHNLYGTGSVGLDPTDFDPSDSTFYLTGNSFANAYLFKWLQDSCDLIGLVIDSVSAVRCVTDGFAYSHVINGTGPGVYMWNTVPPVSDSIVSFDSAGIYQLVYTDPGGCVLSRNILVTEPAHNGYFDLNVSLLSAPFRPGFDSTYLWLDGFNDGCNPVSGTMSIVLDPLVTFNSAIPAPDVISGDTLKWNFTSLTYDSAHITPQIDVTTSASAVIGDSICFTVMITPVTGDADTTNNYKYYCFPVVNGYDPNDKQVYPQGECEDRIVAAGQKMTYTVRFQNTGTADAINIYILDSLDSDLDLNSVRVTGNSHNLITEILPGNVLKFRFDNIHLPDSTSDEAHSHGYVIYEVDQQPGLSSGTLLENTAYIYFDFNPAIITNTVTNKVGTTGLPCDIVTSNQENKTIDGVKVYPNPANESITVSTDGTTVQNVTLLDLSGRQILNVQPAGTNTVINLSALQKGIYFVKVIAAEGERTVKVMKQ